MITLSKISKIYKTGNIENKALDDISISFRDSEFVAILGTSGSGKTTMLNILGGLDKASLGDLVINGVSTQNYKDKDWDTYRNHHVGFIFQSYNLIPHQSILANVELALTLNGIGPKERKERSIAALEKVGLGDHISKKPNQLSGGQAQRVAIARALVNNPDIILADEPTGALDTQTGIQVMDILKEVSQDRLVIMVTHNPQLAEEYATRIVSLTDGHIVHDTNPMQTTGNSSEEASNKTAAFSAPIYKAPENTQANKKKTKKASMSFLTALSLSFNNLMTKKGRTFLTAFAGSIGIIGIAAILALSNGVNDFIEKTEQDSMSSMPVVISKDALDFDAFKESGHESNEEFNKHTKDGAKTVKGSDVIPQDETIADMYTGESLGIKKNNLEAFKKFVDSNGEHIQDYTNSIVFNYNVNPVFLKETSEDKVELLGNSLSGSSAVQQVTAGMGSMSMSSMSQNGTGAFHAMFDNKDIIDSQYDLLAGSWPSNEHDALLVLDSSGSVSDYLLYQIGVLDNKGVEEYVDSVTLKDSKKKKKLPKVDFSYDQALNLSYKLAPPASFYKEGPHNTWEYKTDDAKLLNQVARDAFEIKVVGVIKPKPDAKATALSAGISYSNKVTDIMIDKAKSAKIVKQQLKHPKIDVFTGRSFEEIKEGNAESFGIENLISVDDEKLTKALGGFDAANLAAGSFAIDPSAFSALDMNDLKINPDDLKIDTNQIISSLNREKLYKIIGNAPAINTQAFKDLNIPESAQEAVQLEILKLSQGFVPWYLLHQADFANKDIAYIADAYIKEPSTQEALAKIDALLGAETKAKIESIMKDYYEQQLIPYAQKASAGIVSEISTALGKQVSQLMTKQMQHIGQSVSNVMSEQLSLAFAKYAQASMQAAAMPGGLSDAISFNMPEEDLGKVLTSYYNPNSVSFEDNLHTLGYAEQDKPESISLYPKSFDDKQSIVAAIEAYNNQVMHEGKSNNVITYSDLMEEIISSITEIVNMISLVLIAFVSISLLVSSIMIGIITYISVLERKKEIGILRAMGASKRNVANVFNAETTIEGLFSGVFAIAVVLLVSLPVNALVFEWKGVPNIMSLSYTSALLLIVISVLLTLVAGIIPSRKASKRDPVEALRSE